MENKKSRISELNQQIGELKEQNDEALLKLGLDAYKHNQNKSEGKYKTQIAVLADLHNTKDKEIKKGKEIKSRQDRIKGINEEEKQLENQIKYLDKENTSTYEDIGQAAFEAYKTSMLRGTQYEEVFSELLKVEDRIDDIEDKIRASDGDTEAKGFLKKIGSGVSKMVFKTRMNITEGSRGKLYQKAGRDLFKNNLLDNIASKEVAAAAKPFLENINSMNSMKEELDSLDQEKNRIESELKSLCDDKKPGNKLSEISSRIAHIDEEINSNARLFANNFAADKALSLVLSKASEKLLVSVPEINKEINNMQTEIEKLKIGIKIDDLNAEKKKKEYGIQVHDQKINEAKEQIKGLKSDIQKIEKEIVKLEEQL